MKILTDLEICQQITLIELNEQFPTAKSIEFDDRQCADCTKEFTEAECEQGVLNEVSEVTFTESDNPNVSFTETHGYKMLCEECYDQHLTGVE